ncbi:MAG TPA: trypsin-like peptidase domain-containing protein, partial [Planctomycetota bacterium]|nr:trypsin-like peptidase domain-containing protein [Planctomycetota bacterium]
MRSPQFGSRAAAGFTAAVFFTLTSAISVGSEPSKAKGNAARLSVAQESLAPAVESAARGLVHVSVLFETKKDTVVRVERSSSGFVVDPRGLVVTNEHLVDEIATGEGAPGKEFWLEVVLDGDRTRGATVLARDERLDLALLQVALEDGEKIDALELAPGPAPAAGSDAFTLGKPDGGQDFALAGTVSIPSGPVTLRQGLLEPRELLITDAAILDVVDGGPFVDRRGRVIGIMNTVQRVAFDPKAKDSKIQKNVVDYAVAVTSETILGTFGKNLAAAKAPAVAPALELTARIVRDGAPSVVSVWAGADAARPKQSAPSDPYAEKPEKGLGSGVIVDSAGLVLTSYAVVRDAQEIGVLLLDGRSFRAKVLHALPGSQAALLQL